MSELSNEEYRVIEEDRYARLAGELLVALSDGRLDREERERILTHLADMINLASLLDHGVEFIVDILHRDQDELRAAAERKRDHARLLQIRVDRIHADDSLEPEVKARRLRRLLAKVDDLEDDADKLDARADALDRAAE